MAFLSPVSTACFLLGLSSVTYIIFTVWLQCFTQSLLKLKEFTEGDGGQDLGSGCFGIWEQHLGAKSNQTGTGANWSSQESYTTPEFFESSFCLIPSVT